MQIGVGAGCWRPQSPGNHSTRHDSKIDDAETETNHKADQAVLVNGASPATITLAVPRPVQVQVLKYHQGGGGPRPQ
jgi:hypothetical protein